MWALASRVVFAIAILLPMASAAPVFAELRLPAVISDGAVLQRGRPATIWGWAGRGERVTVSLEEKSATATAGDDGRWSVQIDPPAAGGPYALRISAGEAISIDVFVGEVWLCSGQSNMEWPVSRSDNAREEIDAAQHPRIRVFQVPHLLAATPQSELNTSMKVSWKAVSPETVAGVSAVAYYFGRELQRELNVPIGLLDINWGGTRIEPWTPPAGFAAVPGLSSLVEQAAAVASGSVEVRNTSPTALYNAMIHPVVPFSIRGAIWYQGESNRADGVAYRDKMQALIAGWRSVFNQGDLPFYFVQLAPYRYDGRPDALGPVWEGQRLALSIPNTGMAVTTDIGNIANIHPTNKQEVGRRLALWALAKTYGKTGIVYSGPLYRSMKIEGGKVRLEFDHSAGLKSADGQPLRWFDVAGADGQFFPADVTIDGETLLVSSERVPQPRTVRYGWSGWLETQPNFVNGAGLPASPFHTGTPTAASPPAR